MKTVIISVLFLSIMFAITYFCTPENVEQGATVKPYIIEVQCVDDCEEVGTEIHRYDYTNKVWIN